MTENVSNFTQENPPIFHLKFEKKHKTNMVQNILIVYYEFCEEKNPQNKSVGYAITYI